MDQIPLRQMLQSQLAKRISAVVEVICSSLPVRAFSAHAAGFSRQDTGPVNGKAELNAVLAADSPTLTGHARGSEDLR